MIDSADQEAPAKQQDRAFKSLRRSIIFLEFKPGEKLIIKDLSDKLGIGRTPIRESLLRLQQEGLVNTVPQSGTYVTRIDLEVAEAQRFIREHLEQQVAVEACAMATDADIEAIDSAIALQETALATALQDTSLAGRAYGDFFVTDNLMHQIIFETAGRRCVWDWLAATNADLERYRLLRTQTIDLLWSDILDEHRQIRDAIAERKPTEVAYLISRHLHMMFADQSHVVREFPDYFAA